MSLLSIVTYHYVRPLNRTRFPNIKARSLEDFKLQIEFLQKTSEIICLNTLVDAILSGSTLPNSASVLTFDDGLADHYTYVFPILHELGVSGTFFPPASPVLERTLLDVHRIHFILASLSSIEEATGVVDRFVRENEAICDSVEAYRGRHCLRGRFDDPETTYLKRMLQFGLPSPQRNALCAELFASFVSVDEEAFAEELYVSETQLRVMHGSGMEIGSHGSSHVRLASCDEDDQRQDLLESINFLRALGVSEESRLFLCYPYGDFDQRTEKTAHELGFQAAVTTESRPVNPKVDSLLRLPRLDTTEVSIA